MKTLALYVKPAGTNVNLVLAPNAQVGPYVVFVQKWVNGHKESVTTWFPAELESPAGSSIILTPDEGYDFILRANILGTPDTASVVPALKFDGAVVYSDTIHLPSAEGPVVSREWSIVIAEGGA